MRLLTIYILTRRLKASTCQESKNYNERKFKSRLESKY